MGNIPITSSSYAKPSYLGFPFKEKNVQTIQIHFEYGTNDVQKISFHPDMVHVLAYSSVRALENKFLTIRDRLRINIT